MGAYLSAPDTRKESEEGKLGNLSFGVSSMQGWRRTQEDAHIAAELPRGTTILGVFDGHGGREVSNFTKAHFAEALTSQKAYADDLPKALIASFHKVDMLLEDKSNLQEIEALKADPREKLEGTESEGGGSSDDGAEAGDDDGKSEKISMNDAIDMFQKLMVLKRQAASEQAAGGAGHVGAIRRRGRQRGGWGRREAVQGIQL